ncbi:hypothetical protein ONE63_006668 [Megalurothrips usitatus]|uniref:Uncharacterized protein n=1 Tax=Megalurothrips usitatus TaxID=439358 RepID=A0AAV7XV44_9NEOP|nr:hypothetical protein ONE63_006668 [Megalurothrips usitatus]
METPVLKNYFISVEKMNLLWESLAKKANKPMSAIETLSDQLQAVKSIGHDMTINLQFPGLEENVIFKTLMSLEQELALIINIIQEVDIATEKLNKLATLVDSQKEKKDMSSATVSTCSVLEVVSDCRQYYQAQYLGLQSALKCLDFRDSNSIRALRKSFIEDKNLKKHVQRWCRTFFTM